MVEHSLSEFFRHNPNAVLIFNSSGALVHKNPVGDRMVQQLNRDYRELLPTQHSEIVRLCLESRLGECTCEVTVGEAVLALTYFPIKAFDLVYVYVVEVTPFKSAEEELMRLMASAITFTTVTKHAITRLKELRRTLPQWTANSIETRNHPLGAELDHLINDLTGGSDRCAGVSK